MPRSQTGAEPLHRLKVCHVITGFDTGGAERVLLKTVERLDSTRFESIIVSLRPPGPLSEEVKQTGVETVYLGMGRRLGLVTLWRLTRLLRRRRTQIVHSYLYMASIAARLAGRLARVPVVVTSTRAPLTYLGRTAWWLDRATVRLCNRIIAVSQDTADVAVRVEGIPRQKITVIPNGVDLKRFTPGGMASAREDLQIDGNAFVVASVGRLSAEKGHEYLLRALAAIHHQIPGLVCVFAGAGPLREQLETEAAALGLNGICRFLGEVSQVEKILAAADVLVLPSLFEGMPNAVLEAMATGCPVIASAVGGTVELVREGETGFLVPAADPASLARALVDMARSAERRNHMRERSRQIAEQNHGIDSMIRSIENVYLDEWQRFSKNHAGSQ